MEEIEHELDDKKDYCEFFLIWNDLVMCYRFVLK